MLSKIRKNTFLKYFFSYFLIILLLLTGFLFIAKAQFESTYNENLYVAAKEQIASIKNTLDNAILTLHEIHYYLESNVDFILYRHTDSQRNLIQLNKRLKEYTTTNSLLSSINYINLATGKTLSSNIPVFKREGYYELYYQETYLPFYLDEYLLATDKYQLIFLEESGVKTAIYLPKTVNSEYCIFYVLNITELYNILTPVPNSGITSVCLLNSDNSIITGYCPEILKNYMEQFPKDSGYHSINSREGIFMTSSIVGGCSLATVISNHEIVSLVQNAMSNTYLLLIVLSVAGFLLIFLAMHTTFIPLHKLTRHLFPSIPAGHSYTELLGNAFSEMSSENQLFQEKLLSYRLFMQKSLLDAVISDRTIFAEKTVNLDHLFNQNAIHHIFVIKIVNYNMLTDFLPFIQNNLENNLPGHEFVNITMLEQSEEYVVLLICYTGSLPKNSDLKNYFNRLHISFGYRTAISNTTCSPLEIPSLYKNAIAAAEMLSDTPVITYSEMGKQAQDSNNLLYPFSQLEELQRHLRNYQFQQAKATLCQLLDLLDNIAKTNEYFTEFFIRCVLIDILTTLANTINEMNIKFQNYNELYFATLYFCRSCSYVENSEEIRLKIMELFNIMEEYSTTCAVNTSMIQQVMNQEYTSPDFSIAVLADILHVSSVPYMSFLFKKHLNINFSDLLWDMRLNKAKSLLILTDMNIDQISVNVGYLNVSSFRRKFKQACGVTPSQYRDKNRTEQTEFLLYYK